MSYYVDKYSNVPIRRTFNQLYTMKFIVNCSQTKRAKE